MNTSKRETQGNARFWITSPSGGWVKLTLKPEQRIDTQHGGRTDEGYSYTRETWIHEGEYVFYGWATNAQDCDGRHDAYGSSICMLENLKARDMEEEGRWYDKANETSDGYYERENKGVFAPEWENKRRGQRDHSAEAMGY